MVKFINALTGNAEKAKASSLGPATQNVTPYIIPFHGLRLVLVDTPGFNGYRSDMEILKLSADWLTKKYVTPQKVSCPSCTWYTQGIQMAKRSESLGYSTSTESRTTTCLVLLIKTSRCSVAFVEIYLYDEHDS